VELQRDLQRNPQAFNDIYLRSKNTQAMVPFNAVANWTEGVGPASINHFAQFPAVNITFNLAPGVALSEGLDHLQKLAQASFSPTVKGSVKGAAESFQESISSAAILLIVTIFTIYIVLGILYESFIHPLTILSTLPPAIVGGLLILFITNKPLSLYAFLGIILLIGIVKKNGIMIVDFALENVRQKGESAEKSIFDACIVRFRPIMMTTMAAIMGAVPIALGVGAGADSRRPLGYVIIAGLCVSQLITLFLTPVIYLYMEQFSEWLEKRKARKLGTS
jgi:HAE1 family hydrophobic/amphiphilic exporter-1